MNENSINHGRLVRNLMRLMDGTCAQTLYEVLPKGVGIWIPDRAWTVYPDVIVIAGQALLYSGHTDKVMNPCLLFEVVGEGAAWGPTGAWHSEGQQSLQAALEARGGAFATPGAPTSTALEADGEETLAFSAEINAVPDMFNYCRQISYLQEYVRVSRADNYVEQYHRISQQDWETTCYAGFNAVVELNVTNARLPLTDIYADVDFSLLA